MLSALAALTIASSLAVVPVAHAAFPGQNGRIAYVTTAGDHQAIYTVDAQGADPRPLIDLGNGRDAINPAWSWDGQSISFAGQTSPGGPFAIYVANADGSGSPRQVTTPVVSDTDPTWEPNGRQIAFTRRLDGDASVIGIVTLSTEVVTTFAGLGVSMEPSWSPDGTSIAFASKDPRSSCYTVDCRFQIWKASPDGQTLRRAGLDWFGDLHHPDWSPDGSLIVARFGRDEDPPYGPSGVGLYDPTTGERLDYLGPCHIMSEPSFSPDGRWVVLTYRPVTDPLTGELGEPNLCVIRTDNTAGYFPEGGPPRSDAAWGPIPGSTPPPPDYTPPTIEFRPDPSASDWLDASFAGHVDIVASDDRSPPSIDCTDNGSEMSLIVGQVGSTTKAVAELPEGAHHLVCTATDEAGNSTTVSATYGVDLTPPSITGQSVTPWVAKVGEAVIISATVSDFLSGVQSVHFEVWGTGSDPLDAGQMSEFGSGFKASFVPTRPDVLRVVISARDRAGLVAESAARFVAYDPLAGSTDGTGWIVPGGPTSDTGDVLPGLDGVQKASFGFTAKYRTPSSETPSGNLTFSYGSRFKLQSKDLWWLAVRDGGIAYLGGFASIQGIYGEFPFVAVIADGANTATPDRFELRVYESLTIISSPTPLFAASGEVGGQIQIKR
jgi:Tol biopolymer transport system component